MQSRFDDQDTSLVTGGIPNWSENRSWRYGLQTKLSHLTGQRLAAYLAKT